MRQPASRTGICQDSWRIFLFFSSAKSGAEIDRSSRGGAYLGWDVLFFQLRRHGNRRHYHSHRFPFRISVLLHSKGGYAKSYHGFFDGCDAQFNPRFFQTIVGPVKHPCTGRRSLDIEGVGCLSNILLMGGIAGGAQFRFFRQGAGIHIFFVFQQLFDLWEIRLTWISLFRKISTRRHC